ncbi:hypothetical protein [Scytonema millei]|nr:hypothetical protein [Scytonema millei]
MEEGSREPGVGSRESGVGTEKFKALLYTTSVVSYQLSVTSD